MRNNEFYNDLVEPVPVTRKKDYRWEEDMQFWSRFLDRKVRVAYSKTKCLNINNHHCFFYF